MLENTLKGSGANHIWLESGVFGPTVIENSVLSGTHYARSLIGMQLLAESMQRLRYVEFFREKGIHNYNSQLAALDALKEDVGTRIPSKVRMI